MNSNNNVKFTTVGQKLLKEPIWIGMVVVFILLIIFGICYVIKKKCAKYTVCCKDMKAILREREGMYMLISVHHHILMMMMVQDFLVAFLIAL